MYDKVSIWIDNFTMSKQGATPQDIARLIEQGKEQRDIATGEYSIFGGIEGLKVNVYSSGVSIIGSLPKFLKGSNIFSLDKRDTKIAFSKMGDLFHMSLDDAQVREIEYGNTFIMEHPVIQYLSLLGDMPRLVRCPVGTTLYYRHRGKEKPKELCIYDKGDEMRKRGVEIPKPFDNANLLRCELTLKGKLAKHTGFNPVVVSTLTEQPFLRYMATKYCELFMSISKSKQMKTSANIAIKTPKDAFDVFIARLINQHCKSEDISGFIEEIKASGVFQDKKSYTRLKKMIQQVSTKGELTETDTLIRELEDSIINLGAYT